MAGKDKKPEIRFAGFADAWEQRKVSELATELVAGGDINQDLIKANGNYPVIANALTNDGIVGYYDKDFRIKAPAVTITGRGDVGHAKARKIDFTPVVRLVTFKSNHDVDFIENAINRLNIIVESTGVPQLTVPQLGKCELYFPSSKEEEKAIGKLFLELDNLITLHQHKYDKLVIIKKSMLEKMFPKDGANVPEIRFAGFADAWKQRKLGDMLIQYSETTTENNQYPALTSSRRGIFFQTEYFAGNQIASEDNTGYNIVPRGYFTFRHMSDDEIFYFNINDIADFGIVSTLYPVFTTNDELDSKYLQYQLNNGTEFRRYAVLQKQGGSRTYMYFNKLRNLNLKIPPKVEEQEKISGFLSQLDNLITLQQRELEKLKNIKKALLEKMFV